MFIVRALFGSSSSSTWAAPRPCTPHSIERAAERASSEVFQRSSNPTPSPQTQGRVSIFPKWKGISIKQARSKMESWRKHYFGCTNVELKDNHFLIGRKKVYL